MKVQLARFIQGTRQGAQAQEILRKCVHCGFCSATCPTYQLLGDELDSPRGRIYLIKGLLEGQAATEKTQLHLDRCLTCRACETTCPSGVEYSQLLEIGRSVCEIRTPRRALDKFLRRALSEIIPKPGRFKMLLMLGQIIKPILPVAHQDKIPHPVKQKPSFTGSVEKADRVMLLARGCAQQVLAPGINQQAIYLLQKLGVQLLEVNQEVCCGALDLHLSRHDQAMAYMRRNIDAWWPFLEKGAQAIVSTASGCGLMLKEYKGYLAEDTEYADKAAKVAGLTQDIVELVTHLLDNKDIELSPTHEQKLVAFQSPCTLQHGQNITGLVEAILTKAGYQLVRVKDAHLCCGSAGSYSILQPKISNQLRANKLASLTAESPKIIATANIGCLSHLQAISTVPVLHWLELIDIKSSPVKRAG